MKKVVFALNTLLVLIIFGTLSYSYIFSQKILKNLHNLNQKSKLYTGFSVPYLEKENKRVKPKSEVLKSFSKTKQNRVSNKKADTQKKIKKRVKKKKRKLKKKKRKIKRNQASLEKRIKYLEREVRRLKKENKK